jgi:predicted Fe-S protein YdhL (DUF1289 family)
MPSNPAHRPTKKAILTPCIGVCSTTYGDLICRGCRRFAHEIDNWQYYGQQEKLAVLKRLEKVITLVLEEKCRIADEAQLLKALIQERLRYNPLQNSYCWAYVALMSVDSKTQLKAFSIEIAPNYKAYSLVQLRKIIDHEINRVSNALLKAHQDAGLNYD